MDALTCQRGNDSEQKNQMMKSETETNKRGTCKGPGAGKSHVTAESECRKGTQAKVLGWEGAMLLQGQSSGMGCREISVTRRMGR